MAFPQHNSLKQKKTAGDQHQECLEGMWRGGSGLRLETDMKGLAFMKQAHTSNNLTSDWEFFLIYD